MRRLADYGWTWTGHTDEGVLGREPMGGALDESKMPKTAYGSGAPAEVVVDSPVERARRIRELRELIDSGQYRIGAEAVAGKVIDQMRRDGATGRGKAKTVTGRVTRLDRSGFEKSSGGEVSSQDAEG